MAPQRRNGWLARGLSRIIRIDARLEALMLVLVLLLMGGCHKPQPTLVVVVGGLGFSQLGDLRKAVTQQCPRVTVVNAGGWDGYKANLKAIVAATPHQHVVFVGHSFGCEAIAQASEQLPAVDLAVFIDPAWNDFPLPRNITRYLWYQRSGIGIEREATIIGASGTRTIQGGHNNIPHSAELIAGVVEAINEIKTRQSADADTGTNAPENSRPQAAGPRRGENGSLARR